MLNKGLISIITPSYNSAKLINRLLNSVLIQTYPNVEMFVIDDGSTDDTQKVVEYYIPLFEDRRYCLNYIYQSNGGQSSAINNGLKLVTGEFLVWPDSDDWYKTKDSLSKMVSILQNSSNEIGCVRCQLEFVAEQSLSVEYTTHIRPCNVPCELLEEAIYQNNDFYYAPIGWMIKMRFLDSFIPDREMYVRKHVGQNAQILFPYLAHTKCVTIDEVLASYLVREKSHSRQKANYEQYVSFLFEQMECYDYVLQSIENLTKKQKDRYLKILTSKSYSAILDMDFMHNKSKLFREHYKTCLELQIHPPKKYRLLYLWTFLFSIEQFKKVLFLIRKK